MRYRYNQQISPPAPFIHVTLARPDGTVATAELPAQLDTAADISAVPATVIAHLGLVQFDSIQIAAFGGILRTTPSFLVQLTVRACEPVIIKVVGSFEESYILLGRDVLNRYRILLDGPREVLEIG